MGILQLIVRYRLGQNQVRRSPIMDMHAQAQLPPPQTHNKFYTFKCFVNLYICCTVCRRVSILTGHSEEISNCLFNHDCTLIASSSMDGTAKVWDQRTFSSLATIMGHNDEVGKSNK